MRNLDIFWIEILWKIGSVRKVANANKPIKTNGFLMISWFARFKNRFGKLQKNMKKRYRKSHAKNIGKSWKKSSKIDAKIMKKPIKNRFKKKVEKQRSAPVNPGSPGGPAGSGKRNSGHCKHPTKEGNLKERSSERNMQRDQPRPFNTPRAPSGPERISNL